ncbi:LOW QUALITY PROTEIN: uncharacterized protein LOC142595745 [Pelecanus crispus]|uniref:LOW QUALITY PROTEIN: uncharacterized protein LOC142595745 n=1 Tax=Pelecanus crispus TaxID=36300 RepID=UPI003F5D06B1
MAQLRPGGRDAERGDGTGADGAPPRSAGSGTGQALPPSLPAPPPTGRPSGAAGAGGRSWGSGRGASPSKDGGGRARRPRRPAPSRRGWRPPRRQDGGGRPGTRAAWRRRLRGGRAPRRFRFLRSERDGAAGPGRRCPAASRFPVLQVGAGMSLSLKMLPCKKRRAAVAGPQSPRERGEDGELPGASGSSSAGAADGGSSAKLAPAARAGGPPSAGPGVWRGPGEASLKGGKRSPARAAPGCAQEAPGAREACAAAQLPEGLRSPDALAEGKRVRWPRRCLTGGPPAAARSCPRPGSGPRARPPGLR